MNNLLKTIEWYLIPRKPLRYNLVNINNVIIITINGSQIEWQRSVKQLSNTINSRLSDDDDDCKVKCSVFIGSVNRFIGNYSLNNCTKRKLYQAYCSSFNGSEIWSIKLKGFNGCCTEWRKATRRVFNRPYNTHSYIIFGPLCGQTSMQGTLRKRMLNMLYSVLRNPNETVSCFYNGKLALLSAKSPMGNTMYKFGIVNDNHSIQVSMTSLRKAYQLC